MLVGRRHFGTEPVEPAEGRYRPVYGFERLPTRVFDFTTGNRRDLYFATLHVFNDAGERLETALRHLESLGLVESSQSYTASYATAAEFERKNVQYTLTARGEAEFAGVRLVLERLKERGALKAAVLEAITDRLGALPWRMGPRTTGRRPWTTCEPRPCSPETVSTVTRSSSLPSSKTPTPTTRD